jgi:hypothetical protein
MSIFGDFAPGRMDPKNNKNYSPECIKLFTDLYEPSRNYFTYDCKENKCEPTGISAEQERKMKRVYSKLIEKGCPYEDMKSRPPTIEHFSFYYPFNQQALQRFDSRMRLAKFISISERYEPTPER